MEKIEQKFLKFVDEQSLIKPGEKILAAFSGGPDSVFLLHLLHKFQSRLKIEVYAIHVNHLLRGKDSDEDEEFCNRFCRELGIKFFSVRKRVRSFSVKNRISLEEAGRLLRYKEFEKTLRQNKLDKIATAHNASDNTETVLLNLIKGTGLDGISGIPSKRDNIIRPVLCFTKEEIFAYLQQKNILYRIDKTNIETDYERNFLRHNIIPLIKEKLNPSLDTSILNSSDNFKDIKAYISSTEFGIFGKLQNELSRSSQIQIDDLIKINQSLRGLFLKNLLEKGFAKQVFANDIKKILSLITQQVGKRVELSGDMTVFRERDSLKFLSTHGHQVNEFLKIHVSETKITSAGKLSIRKCDKNTFSYSNNKNKEYISGDTLSNEFIIRRWKPGDSFYPFGMKNSKKISDFLNEQKVESSGKKNHLIILNNNEVVWVVGLRLDDRFKITPSTKNVLELCLT